MSAFVNIARTLLLGTAWTGTAPGPTVATPAGTITSTSDLSGFLVSGADPGWSSEMVDVTHHAALGYSVVIPGITTGDKLVCDLNADTAASQLNAIIRTTLGGIARPGSAPIYVDIKPTVAARSATNPSFVAAVFISKWGPYSGAVKSRAKSTLELTITGTFIDLTS